MSGVPCLLLRPRMLASVFAVLGWENSVVGRGINAGVLFSLSSCAVSFLSFFFFGPLFLFPFSLARPGDLFLWCMPPACKRGLLFSFLDD